MEFTQAIPAALLSLYVGASNIIFAERICQTYRRWGVEEWLADPGDCRGAGAVAIGFSALLLVLPIVS